MVKWSPSESPAAKTLGACGPSGFGLGTSLGTSFTTLPPRLFQIMSQYLVQLHVIFNRKWYILGEKKEYSYANYYF